MDKVKKFWVPILAGVVALLAIVLTFVPLRGWVSGVDGDLQTAAGTFKALEDLRSRKRSIPNFESADAPRTPLTDFPTRASIQQAMAAADTVIKSADSMLAAAVKMNARNPLVPGSLPSPSANDAFRFRDAYRTFMTETLPKSLGAVAPPGETEVQSEKDRIWKDEYEPRIVSGSDGPLNEVELRVELDAATSDLSQTLQSDWAKRHKLYMEPDVLTRAGGIEGSGAPPAASIWDAQLLLWLQSDILDAIQAINAGSANILDAPVKHVARLSVVSQPLNGTAAVTSGAALDTPASVIQTPFDPVTFNFDVSPTGRVSNGLFDVYEFTLVLNVDATQLPRILAEFGDSRLLYIRQLNVAEVDRKRAEASGFFFGDAPVAQISIDGEALMLRKWTEPLMPASVRQQMGLPPLDAAAGAPVKG